MASLLEPVDLTTLTKEQLLERKKTITTRLQLLECKKPPPAKASTTAAATITDESAPPPPTVPSIPKQTDTHTDYTHKELAWLSADYASERKRQISSAKKISASILHHFASLPSKRRRERIESEARVKRLAARLMRSVDKGYWKKIERVVGYKQKIAGETNQRREMDRQLIRMVKETERYGERLRENNSCNGGGMVSIEEALREWDAPPRCKRKDYSRLKDVEYESLYGEDEFSEDEEEYCLGEDESEDDDEEERDYATFMEEIAHVSRKEIVEELGLLMEEGEMDLQLVLKRLMEDSAGELEQKNPLIEVINETVDEGGPAVDDDVDTDDASSGVDTDETSVRPNNISLLDEDDHEKKDEFHPSDEMDDETTIEAEERLGREMSYADEIAMLQRENEMSIDELRAMYADIERNDDSDESSHVNEPESSDEAAASSNLILLDEDDHEEKDEFHPSDEVDDETTIEAEEKLGREMSYADEIAMLQRENEMSIDELRAMYSKLEQQHGADSDNSFEDEKDATNTAGDLSLLDEDDHEEKDEFHPDNEEDDETTIEAEERLGREMTYADEIAMLERENEMSIDELRAMYANMEQKQNESDDETLEEDSCIDDVTVAAANICTEKSSLAMLNATINDADEENEEEFTVQDDSMEVDDETTIEAEERLGREMTYEQEISQLEQENEMTVEELRKVYGLDQSDTNSSDGTDLKRKQDDVVDESDNNHSDQKKQRLNADEDEGLTALQALAATDARARQTMLARPFLLASWVKLRNYQHIGLNWLVSLQTRRLNGILADEMGLGKTLQTISMLSYLASYKGIWGPHLIIVPTSCLVNWEVEFKRFCPGLKVVCYYGNAKRRKELRYGWTKTNYHHVVITSYQLAVQDSFAFKRKKWYYLILDEAHNIKNFESQRWQTLINFNTQRRLLLTGTPLQNNLMELWSLLHFLMPHVFRDRKDFAYWFSNPMDNIIEGNVKRNDDLINRLHGIIRPFVLRRLKKDVETQLPGKYEHIVKCQLSRRQMFLYEEFMARSSTRKAMSGGNFMGMMNVLMQLRKVCNHPDLFEPRSVVTPFSMEPLSMSTASCVVKAIEPKSGLDRLSSHLLLPLWSMAHGLPSLDDAAAVDGVLAKQLAYLMTPETIIFDNAKARGSSESKPTADMDDGLVSFLSGIRDLDDQSRLEKARFDSNINSWRCHPMSFPYSNRLCAAVYMEPLPIDLPLFDEMTVSQIAMTPKDLLAMKKSQEQRANDSNELIEKFVFCVPKASPTNKPVLFSSSPTTSVVEKELMSKTGGTFSKYFTPFQKANSRLTLCFPDKKLVQFDAGKLQSLATLLRDLKHGGHRVLIFTQMSKMLDVLEAFLNLNGHTYLRLDGATDVDRRQRLMDRFNNDKRVFCFILSTRSGGLGINLTGADTVIFYDSDWNPAMDAQAQDRAHRIGQTREVHIYRMVTEHSIEENILTKAKQKRNLDFLVMDEGKFHANSTATADNGDVEEDSDTEEGFTKNRLKNILGIDHDSTNVTSGNQDKEDDMDQDQMQSAMNMLEDEEDVQAMQKAKKEAAEALEEFDESKELKQESDEWQTTSATKSQQPNKPKKERPPKKTESASSDIDLDASDKTDDSSKEDDDEKAMELEFANWQSRVGMDASQIDDSLNPLERYGLKIKEYRDPYYSKYFWKEQERLAEAAAMNNDWDLDEIERIKVEEEQKAFEDGDLLSTFPDPESLPRQRHLYRREKARLRSGVIERKLTGQNWAHRQDEVSGKSFWYNVDTGETSLETPAVLKMLKEEDSARANGWALLPSKPLVNIMEFLLPSPDRIQCSTVCKSWSAASRDISFVLHVWPVEAGALVMDEKNLSKNHFRTIADAVKVARSGDSIELGDGHYWVNDPGLVIDFPLRFLGDEDDPSHVVVELSGELVWKAKGGWMEGIMIRRPKLVSGAAPCNEILRLEQGGRLDIWHCLVDNRGCIGNCVSISGSGAGGTWERLNVHGASNGFSGLLVNEGANLHLVHCEISSNDGVGLTRIEGSNLKLSTCTIDRNGTDRVKRSTEEIPNITSPVDTKTGERVLIADDTWP